MGDEAGTAPHEVTELQRSSRDHHELAERLGAWLTATLPDGAEPSDPRPRGHVRQRHVERDAAVRRLVDRGRRPRASHRLVARVAPGADDVPVFPRYDLPGQFAVIRLVGELTDVPVPTVWWCEPDPAALGAPFFVMSRVDGRVPPDVMPYNFGDSWLYDAAPADQRHLQDATVDVLARLHAVDRPAERFAFLDPRRPGATPLRRRVALTRDWYEFAAADGFALAAGRARVRLARGALARATRATTVLSWGDSRIGNMMFDDFDPVAVLDWEMAGLGPRELDVAWLVYGHRIFEDIAGPDGPRRHARLPAPDDVATTYEQLTGYALPRPRPGTATYAALQYAIVFLRTGARSVHFGEAERPADRRRPDHEPRPPSSACSPATYWS